VCIYCKNSLKIPKGSLEAVDLRRIDNTVVYVIAERPNNGLQNFTNKTKNRPTRIALKTWGRHRYFGRVSSSCCTRCFTLVTHPGMSQDWWNDQIVITTNGTIKLNARSFVTQMLGRIYISNINWLTMVIIIACLYSQ
jgi:hypothetical protein